MGTDFLDQAELIQYSLVKTILLPATLAIALFTVSCKRSINRDKLKTVFVDGCEKSFRKQAPQIQDIDVELSEYCNCSADKVLQDLSDDELRYFDTHVAEMQSPKMQARLEQVSQPCLDEFTQKVQAKVVQ